MTIDRPIDPIEAMIWAYVRGETDVAEFEAWVYATPDLDSVLGHEDYLAVAACDYRDTFPKAIDDRLKEARAIVTRRFARRCSCLSLPNAVRHTMSGPKSCVEEYADVLARKTPWIEVLRCRDCGTHWFQGTDTVDDDYYLYRLTEEVVEDIVVRDRWPTVFDDRPNVWPISGYLGPGGFESLEAWRAVHDPSKKRSPR
jgi:hypothetical protein